MSQFSDQQWVPVVSSTGEPLMPCRPVRARKFVLNGRAVKRWRNRIFYIQMLDVAKGVVQPVAVGIDPGSKMEGYTVKATHRTFLNIQSHARDGKSIQRTLEGRANARRARRGRKTPYRQPRFSNRSRKNWIPPSTKARWQLKLNVVKFLMKLYPVSTVVVEDVKATTKKGGKRWNNNFSPVQVGKNWFYSRLEDLGIILNKKSGMETFAMRQSLGLYKSKNKLNTVFSAHCVDSWVLANNAVGGHSKPDLQELLVLKPLSYSRRQLHRFNPRKGGERSRYGSTMAMGIKKGTMVIHSKHGKTLTGGTDGKENLSLHSCMSLSRLCQNAKLKDIQVVSYSPWIVTGLRYNQPVSVKQHRRVTRLNDAQLRNFNIG